MSVYNNHILPKATHFVCSAGYFDKNREMIVPKASGIVLEVGFGTGLNLPFYLPEQIQMVYALDPSGPMLAMAEKKFNQVPFPVKKIEASAEDIPLDENSIDTIVSTYSMCTIGDLPSALSEMKRLLKPEGKLLFCEHGASSIKPLLYMQNFFNPAWKMIAGGCNLNRQIGDLIENSGFSIRYLKDREHSSVPRRTHFIGIAHER